MRRVVLIAVSAALLAGCGEQRTPAPDLLHAVEPDGFHTLSFADAGVSFEAPLNWQRLPAQDQMVGGISSKTAVVAVWRYPRSEPLPADRDELAQARDRLEERIRLRDPTFALDASRLARFDGARGIEVTGRQTISGRPYDVRSAHVFDEGAEIVVDAYAPVADFARVDGAVFVPLIASLTVTAPDA